MDVGIVVGSFVHDVDDFGASGMVHRPFVWFCLPLMMMFPFFMICKLYLLNMATQSLSHSWPMERSDPDLRSLKMCAVVACFVNVGAKGSCACVCGVIMFPLATFTLGPLLVRVMSLQCGKAVLSR